MFSIALFTSMEWWAVVCFLITVVVSYFLGNISPAILIGRMKGIDIKKEGSGNAGTTNVLRVLGKQAAAATLIIDILKGVVAVLLGRAVGLYFLAPQYGILLVMACGLAAFLGHIWPLAFGFKGGKGVATGIGILLAVKPMLGVMVSVIALLVVVFTKRVSAGSVVGSILCPVMAGFLYPEYFWWSLAMAIVVIVKHRENIRRLLKG
ncbi:MAG: glycerol-3-phosphate 1-O-acyltransferase PlsY, partial [Anaerovorax sp.]